MMTSTLDRFRTPLAALAVLLGLVACATTAVPNASGVATTSIDPATRGPVHGVGIESHDIVAMSDQMMRDMLSNPRLASLDPNGRPRRVIIDAQYFQNDSTQPINRNLITDRLRVALNRASNGRMAFVGRHYAGMVEKERTLKREGVVDVATTGLTRAAMGADFRLGGRIASIDQKSSTTGMIQRYTQITFEMVDLESQEIVWSGIYEFARSAADDVMYR
jgi:PBP1b-binding outer membrane lipoprotein LpoB